MMFRASSKCPPAYESVCRDIRCLNRSGDDHCRDICYDHAGIGQYTAFYGCIAVAV